MSRASCLPVSLFQVLIPSYPCFSFLDIAAADTVSRDSHRASRYITDIRLDEVDLENVLLSNGPQPQSDEKSTRGIGSRC